LHGLFWISYLSFFGILWGSYEGAYLREFAMLAVQIPVAIGVVYLNLYGLIPRYLHQKDYPAYALYLGLAMIVAGGLQRIISYYIIDPYYFPQTLSWSLLSPYKIIKYAVGLNTVVFFTSIIKILQYWYADQQMAQQMTQEKLEAELKFLKGQIHPHFLFNTLNNLYALTLQKSDCAPEVVLKLSELMDYMLYQTNARLVTLKQEITYLKNYISLEKIRYGERVDIGFHVSGDLHAHRIAPLLLLPFIENSFKHGVSSELDKAWVSIDLTLRDNTLIYKVENSRSNQPVKHSRRDYAEGIGLDNLKRRLALIYKEGYDLKIFDEETTFLAVLKLNLDFKPLVPKHLLTYSAPAESSNPRKKICFIKISP
ncbi:MAG: histidine kinase, partial [Bacteroidia bacterium]|nr:histidine kinase [Bacteroidia bacterium]